VGPLERLDLVVPHGSLQGEGVEEEHGIALPSVDDIDRLTVHIQQRH
jgi:hypothetical protein